MPLNIVLVEPEIPNNTGNIGRLSLAAGCHLHLVKPLGFSLDDSRVKRSGLDYWKHVSLHIYENMDAFMKQHNDKEMVFLSSHGKLPHWEIPFTEDLFFIFGKESVGLPLELIKTQSERVYKIPIQNKHIRSLNLANAVSIVVYEGKRQLQLKS